VTTKSDERYSVYIVLCADGSLYTGIAKDLDKRIIAHNLGRGAKYTKARGPVILKYVEIVSSRGQALSREYEIKKLSRLKKQRLIDLNITKL
jgi:putative endonuclease